MSRAFLVLSPIHISRPQIRNRAFPFPIQNRYRLQLDPEAGRSLPRRSLSPDFCSVAKRKRVFGQSLDGQPNK